MDPLTHALLGATAAQAGFGRRLGQHAWRVGALAGMLPDVDFFIRSAADPLLNIEYHRQFTHSLLFIPLGALIAALPWLLRHKTKRWALYGAALVAMATHGLLDACTNYGTHLLWPFSDLRVAWNWLTTIGPLFTLLLLVGLVVSVRRGSRRIALLTLALASTYVGTAVVQRARALDVQALIAAERGHAIARAEMFPTVGNALLWRSVYEHDGVLHTDRIRIGGPGSAIWKPGSTVALVQESDLSAAEQADPRVRRDWGRFFYFSDGWVARSGADPSVLGDARYSLSTESFSPIWGIRFHPGAPVPTEWVDRTAKNRIPLGDLWREITGTAPGYQPPPMHR